MGNRCHFHSFYDTTGLAYLKGSKFTLIIRNSVSGISFWSLLIYLYFQIITELNSCP